MHDIPVPRLYGEVIGQVEHPLAAIQPAGQAIAFTCLTPVDAPVTGKELGVRMTLR